MCREHDPQPWYAENIVGNPHANVLVSGGRGRPYIAAEIRRVIIAPRAAGDDVERFFGT